LDLLAMSILHLVISRHKHPAVPVTEAYNFWVFDIGSEFTVFIPEPFRKPLYRKSGCPETHSNRLG
ncbi:MAG: hypothetical protein WBM04_17560, partial [Candidatus Korobacteraceae bacterium]